MERSSVFFSDFRTKAFGDGLTNKLKKLVDNAGIEKLSVEGKFVAIKMHFGERGNLSYLRPNYARALVETVKGLGGKPFLTDCNTMYPGSRKNALEHLECAWENGFGPLAVGCPLIIGDGLKGTDEIEVPVQGDEISYAKIGRAIMDADAFISLTHFKGHEMTGFGGAIKNIGMGCASRAGKKEQHSSGQPTIDVQRCCGCTLCLEQCANEGLVFNETTHKMTVDYLHCVGCGRCLGACNFDAISFKDELANVDLNRRMAEYTKAVIQDRPHFHVSLIVDVSPNCDCHPENDAPIIPNIGMFASFDPLALDQACVDACLQAPTLENSQLTDRLAQNESKATQDIFSDSNPTSEWRSCLEHAEELGIGTRSYNLIRV